VSYHDIAVDFYRTGGDHRCKYIPPQGHIKIRHVDWPAIWAMHASTPEQDRQARMKQDTANYEHDKKVASGGLTEARRSVNMRIDKWMRGGKTCP
jgi:hypothetical protein